MDYILNGQANGHVASVLMANNFDPHGLRPFIGADGRSYVTRLAANGKPEVVVCNAPATLRKDDWKILDDAIVKAAKPRLRAVGDLRGAGLAFTIPNGMAKTVLETETQSDISPATISMDGLRAGQSDRPEFNLTNLPLPIIHKDFGFSARQVMASRNGGSPLDTTTAELASRRVAEEAEKLLLGVSTVADQFAYGGGTIYGYTDHPNRNTKTITSPAASGWTAATTVSEVLAMKSQSQTDNHFGPWMLYCSMNWDQYMDDDYNAAGGSDLTLRQRLRLIEGIQDVRTLDYLSNYDLVMVSMTSDVARMVVGMDITTVQWETHGGLQLNFKVMAILVPQIRSDFNDQSGIVHASV